MKNVKKMDVYTMEKIRTLGLKFTVAGLVYVLLCAGASFLYLKLCSGEEINKASIESSDREDERSHDTIARN